MINEETNVLETPYNLVTLSQATGNPMLDLGYQCCDMRPFFKYTNGNSIIFTTIHPNNLANQVVNVYEKYTKKVDGIEYASMQYIGNTTATNFSNITYEGNIYNYTNTHENIRGFFINKWARYKPIQHNKIDELNSFIEGKDTDDFINNNCGLTLLQVPIPTSGGPMSEKEGLILNMINDLKAGNFFWTYNPPKEGNWFRMTDFIGYNKKAKNPFYMEYVGGIGPTSNDVRDIYIDTKDNTYEVKITLGEEKEMFLPENNVTTECLPTYFKQLHALGLVYEGTNGVGLGFVDPYDPEDKTSEGFLYPLRTGESVDIPLTIRVGATYSIGAFLINKDSGDTGYYFPIKPLNLRFLRIPDLVSVKFSYYAQGKDLVITATATRRGDTWWWGTHRPDASIIEARTVVNYAPFNDLPIQIYTRKGTSQQWDNEANDDVTMRVAIKNEIEYEWNGCNEVNTQVGVTNPISEIPSVHGSESIIFKFRFVELKDAGFVTAEKTNPGTYSDIKIEGNLYLGTTNSGYRTQMLSLGREVFEEIGWLTPINTDNN